MFNLAEKTWQFFQYKKLYKISEIHHSFFTLNIDWRNKAAILIPWGKDDWHNLVQVLRQYG